MSDLNNHLFAQLERMGDDMTPAEIESEARRSDAMVKLADQIVGIAELGLRAAKIYVDSSPADRGNVLAMLPRIGNDSDAGTATGLVKDKAN